ncbi:MAG: chemotaxis protein CheA [Chloroflexota bacterium]
MAGPNDVSAEELKVFMQEAECLIALLDEDIVRLEQQGGGDDLLQEIFRSAHTLKGSSAMLGFEEMARLTHAMEDLLDRLRRKALAVSPAIIDALLMSLDGLELLCERLRADDDSAVEVDPIIEMLHVAATGVPAAIDLAQSLEAIVASDPTLLARVEGRTLFLVAAHIRADSEWVAVRCFQVLNALDRSGEVIASVPSQADVEAERVGRTIEVLVATDRDAEQLTSMLALVEDLERVSVEPWHANAWTSMAAAEPRLVVTPRIEALQSTVRIDVAQLDSMMNMVGELVIDRTRVSQLGRFLDGHAADDDFARSLQEAATHMEKVVDELHERMMRVRMLPVGLLFSKFPRLVRDLGRGMDKQIRLEIEGEDTEIDRSVIEKIGDPLVQLIRNAAAHGIESAEERAAAGKPEVATLRLTARHDQGQIAITLEDEGRGIDLDRVRARAIERGVIDAEQAARMTADEVVALIFEPGLSTADETTEVSGRGVGMDIVRRDIEALKGRVEVETERGRGTVFRLWLPLTLATIRGLLVSCGATTYAIPLHYVRETLRPTVEQLQTIGGRPVLALPSREVAMSMLWLDEALGATSGREVSWGAPCVAVDRLIDQQELVVKSLSSYLGRARGIAGASILGDGEVVLIVDVASLINGAPRRASLAAAA